MKKFIADEMKDNKIETELWKEVTDNFIYHAHSMCVFMDIFKSEHRKLHELRITIDTLTNLLRDRRGEEDEEESRKKRRIMKKKCTTPKKIKTVKFIKVSPKSYEIHQKYNCTACDKSFVFLKSLKRHIKDQHEGTPIPPEFKEKKDLITCKICNVKKGRDQMQRHLKNVHNITKVEIEDKKTTLRGWFSMDNVRWSPLWLGANDDEPEGEINVQVEGNEIELFGVKYEVEDDNIVVKNADASNKAKKMKLDIPSGFSRERKEVIIEEPDIPKGRESSQEECVGFVQDAFVHDESFETASPERKHGVAHKRNLFGSVSEEDFSTQILETDGVPEEITGRSDEDVFERNDFKESLVTLVSDQNSAMETTGQSLKLKVFVEKEKEKDFWNMETDENDNVDSDFEQGDTESFTESRVEMKKQRLVLFSCLFSCK